MNINWQHATHVKRFDEGNSAFLVQFPNQGGIVVKGTMNAANEFYGNLILCALGFSVPRFSIVQWPSAEWHEMKEVLSMLAAKEGEGQRRVIAHILDRTVLVIQAYVTGCYVTNLQSNHFCDTLFALNLLFFMEIGALIGADVVLNNSDRLPCGDVWKNDGNLGNLLVSYSLANEEGDIATKPKLQFVLLPIDNTAVTTNNADFWAQKVAAVATDPKKYATEIVRYLLRYISLSACPFTREEAVVAVAQGLTCSFQRVIQLASSLDSLYLFVLNFVRKDWEDCWGFAVRCVRRDFLSAICSTLVELGVKEEGGKDEVITACDWKRLHETWHSDLWTTPAQFPERPVAIPKADEAADCISFCLCQNSRCTSQVVLEAIQHHPQTDSIPKYNDFPRGNL